MIKVKNLNKTFVSKKSSPGFFGFLKPKIVTEFQAVRNLNFEIEKSEFVAFLGPNGAGKTTTLKILTGILFPTSGDINVFGYNPFEKKKQFKKMISFVMAQKTQLFLELPIKDTFDFFAEIYEVDKHKYKKLVAELVERFELGDKLETTGRRLSLGQRMKCELICSFLYEPKVIFLDEPTIGLDVNSAQEVRRFLKETNKSLGTTVILTTHNMEDVEELCERTIVINKGKKMFDGQTKELKKLFGDKRIIEFILEKDNAVLSDSSISEISSRGGEVIENKSNRFVVKSNRLESSQIISTVLNSIQVIEINFHEDDLADVIAKVYKQ
ncbi:MAG: ATP-binding cassette domain-containing protein [bacterium]|nr:ATP-binding cassette domain-containing protein [bacterium]